MQTSSAAGAGPVRFEPHETTPHARLVQPGSHTGEAHYHNTYELLVARQLKPGAGCMST